MLIEHMNSVQIVTSTQVCIIGRKVRGLCFGLETESAVLTEGHVISQTGGLPMVMDSNGKVRPMQLNGMEILDHDKINLNNVIMEIPPLMLSLLSIANEQLKILRNQSNGATH